MSEHINTYAACKEHKNGHAEHCEKCETEALRGLLREVAQCYDEWDFNADHHSVAIPNKLWNKILPLRTPPVVDVNGNG